MPSSRQILSVVTESVGIRQGMF